MSDWNWDIRAEKELGNFLDENFYSILEKENKEDVYDRNNVPIVKPIIDGFTRNVSSWSEQYKGVDITVKIGDKVLIIDEKAQLKYINDPRPPTFAFELSYMKKGVLRDGWFVNDEKDTEYYGLFWIHESDEKDRKVIESNDFKKVECIIISKKSITDYLDGEGLGKID